MEAGNFIKDIANLASLNDFSQSFFWAGSMEMKIKGCYGRGCRNPKFYDSADIDF